MVELGKLDNVREKMKRKEDFDLGLNFRNVKANYVVIVISTFVDGYVIDYRW